MRVRFLTRRGSCCSDLSYLTNPASPFPLDLQPLGLPSVNGASALSAEAAVSSSRLHGTKPPAYPLVTEKPWHYAAALMFARGEVSAKEVAKVFDVSLPTIYNLMRQQWFQERVTKFMLEAGRDVMQLFRGESYNSLMTLVELRDNEKVSSAVRRTSAVDILDRALGKPLQRVEQSNVPVSSDPVAEAARLEEQNERLRKSSPPQ
jgi:hypothetical protein